MYLKPYVKFRVKDFDSMAEIFESFFDTDEALDSRFATDIAAYFGIDVSTLKGKTTDQRLDIIKNILRPIHDENLSVMEQRVAEYQDYWNQNCNIICEELEKIFRVKFKGVQEYTAEININTICPRYLNDCSFDVDFRCTKEQTLQTCIHELIHFVWFELWKELYPDCDTSCFETPHTEWLLSEIAIDPIVYFSELKNFCNDRPAYDYFYTTTLWEENLIEVFRRLYRANNIDNFMERGLKLLNSNPDLVKELVK